MGLIPYSYGSVVKNLNVVYQSGISAIRYSEKDSSGVPGSFFGGVIGCIMGGDNVIDGVAVSSPSGAVVAVSSSNTDPVIAAVTGESSDSHLVPIGGYVGAVTGGGVVILRVVKVRSMLGITLVLRAMTTPTSAA